MRLTPRMVSRRGHPKKMEWAVPAEGKEIRKDFCTSHHITPQWVCAHSPYPYLLSPWPLTPVAKPAGPCNPSPCHITTFTRNAKCAQVRPYQPALR